MMKRASLLSLYLLPTLAFSHGGGEGFQIKDTYTYYHAEIGQMYDCGDKTASHLTVEIPEGMRRAEPVFSPENWLFQRIKLPLDKPYTAFGNEYRHDVRQIIWFGKKLSNNDKQEFIFKAKLASDVIKPLTTSEHCVSSEIVWKEIPWQQVYNRSYRNGELTY